MTRNYPKEFNIAQEINLVCFNNWFLCWYFEFLARNEDARSFCIFGLYNLLGFGEIFRSVSIITSLFVLTLKSHDHSTKTYIWLFNDLSKFVVEPTCYLTFLRYLQKKEPTSREISSDVSILKVAINSYLEDFEGEPEKDRTRSPTGSSSQVVVVQQTPPRVKFLDALSELGSSFYRFKGTVACHSLKKQLLEADQVYDRSYR